jgi:hypothetical protein
MRYRGLVGLGFAALFAVTTAVYAADQKKDGAAKETPKTAETPVTSSRGAHVVKPYSDLKDLSSEQEAQLKSIHAKYLAEINQLKAKEKDESMAVLSEDQRKELVEVTAKLAAEKKVAAANAKAQKASESTK